MRIGRRRRREHPFVQGVLPFRDRVERLDRLFKRVIVGLTVGVGLLLVVLVPIGRSTARSVWIQLSAIPDRIATFNEPRGAFERRRRRERLAACDNARNALARVEADGSPGMARLLRLAGMDARTAIVRWGNFDQALAFPSTVFEVDDAGRSYRPRPNTESIWVIGLSLFGVSALFQIPDTPELRDAAAEAGGQIVPASVHWTNSWGCRGVEPDPGAPIRGIVLGDSCMQGALIGDAEAPPARLERRLSDALGAPVSILNTGVLGYSPEQEYATLVEFGDRFRPQFVIVSVCSNDFGDMSRQSNWEETEYWLDRITQYCRTRELMYIIVPISNEEELLGRRDLSVYPGQVTRVLKQGGANYVDPLEAFTDEQLRLRIAADSAGRPLSTSPLYNRHLRGDRHFSASGADLWAREVSRRLLLLWSSRALTGIQAPGAVAEYARRVATSSEY